ncbi:hypothetical protein CLIB1444_02S04148 [[Candida] jaroonii]|uniref:Uncharacterized protein n=1 Tax=[Candida] jaroonii TaxID=467808 RepID=A0ACA9Y343_9ASCO|nr:hypothetical protein CLIB1444_02S04148 [[Candida] jaroonii]
MVPENIVRNGNVYDYEGGDVYVPFSFNTILKYFNRKKQGQEEVDCDSDYSEVDCDSDYEDDCDSDDDWFFDDLDYDSDGYDTDYEGYQLQHRDKGPLSRFFNKKRINQKPLVRGLKQLTNKTMDPFRELSSEMNLDTFDTDQINRAWNKFYHLFAPFKHKLLKAVNKMADVSMENKPKSRSTSKSKSKSNHRTKSKEKKLKSSTSDSYIQVTKQSLEPNKNFNHSTHNTTILNDSFTLNSTCANDTQIHSSRFNFSNFTNFTSLYDDSASPTIVPLIITILIMVSL